MFRALTILATIVALAVSAAPAASAGPLKKPPPRPAQAIVLIGANDYGLVAARAVSAAPASAGISFGAGKDRGWVKAPPKPPRRGSGFAKVIDLDGRFTGFKDGTSNTLQSRSGSNGIIAILIG